MAAFLMPGGNPPHLPHLPHLPPDPHGLHGQRVAHVVS